MMSFAMYYFFSFEFSQQMFCCFIDYAILVKTAHYRGILDEKFIIGGGGGVVVIN